MRVLSTTWLEKKSKQQHINSALVRLEILHLEFLTWYQQCFDWFLCYPITERFLFSKWRHLVDFQRWPPKNHIRNENIDYGSPRRARNAVYLVMIMWYSAMPSSEKKALKDLYLASNVGDLNEKAETGLPVDRNANPATWVPWIDSFHYYCFSTFQPHRCYTQ